MYVPESISSAVQLIVPDDNDTPMKEQEKFSKSAFNFTKYDNQIDSPMRPTSFPEQ